MLDTFSLSAPQGSRLSASNTLASPCLLDGFPTSPAVAYSLRLLRSQYNGPVIRVRRSVDNAELAIWASPYGLDVATLLTFVGSGNGFVSVWYDQSGNGLHATQPIAANQPRIVNAGVVDSVYNMPSVCAPGVQGLDVPAISGTAFTGLAAWCQDATNNACGPWNFSNSAQRCHAPYTDGFIYEPFFSATRYTFGTLTNPGGEMMVYCATQSGTTLDVYRNNVKRGNTVAVAYAAPTSRSIFNGYTNASSHVSEIILFNSALSASNRADLSRAMGARYSVSVS